MCSYIIYTICLQRIISLTIIANMINFKKSKLFMKTWWRYRINCIIVFYRNYILHDVSTIVSTELFANDKWEILCTCSFRLQE